jgi:hypothetical protein
LNRRTCSSSRSWIASRTGANPVIIALVRIMLAFALMGSSLLYGFSLAVQPTYATAEITRFAGWTQRLPKLAQCGLAFLVWLAFMTGLRLFATRAG